MICNLITFNTTTSITKSQSLRWLTTKHVRDKKNIQACESVFLVSFLFHLLFQILTLQIT